MLFMPRQESNSLSDDPASPYLIRAARVADRESIGDLWLDLMEYHRERDPRFKIGADARAKYIRNVQEMIRMRECRVLVAENRETGELVGYVTAETKHYAPVTIAGLYGAISDFYVSPLHRRHALGKRMAEEVFRWMHEKKCVAVQLNVAEANPEGQAFWAAMGMEPFLRLLHKTF